MILKLKDLKKAVNEKIVEIFPNLPPPYGKDVLQGHKRPCFFTEIYVSATTQNGAYRDNEGVITLTYLQNSANELDALEKWDAINEKIGTKIKVGKRYINVDSKDYSWIGKDSDILQIEIDISYTDLIEKEETEETMKEIKIGGL